MRFNITAAAYLLSMLVSATLVMGQDTGQKEEEDDDSKERLIRRTLGEQDEDIMSEIMRQMQDVGMRLDEFFDAGQETQRKQDEILDQLDEAIEQAKQNMRAQRSGSPGEGDAREEGEASGESASGEETAADGGSEAGEGAGGDQVDAAKSGTLHDRQRQWGNLPQRDREEVMQGSNEEILEKYRELVNRYYEALAKEPEEE